MKNLKARLFDIIADYYWKTYRPLLAARLSVSIINGDIAYPISIIQLDLDPLRQRLDDGLKTRRLIETGMSTSVTQNDKKTFSQYDMSAQHDFFHHEITEQFL